jgi:hypothetical protein
MTFSALNGWRLSFVGGHPPPTKPKRSRPAQGSARREPMNVSQIDSAWANHDTENRPAKMQMQGEWRLLHRIPQWRNLHNDVLFLRKIFYFRRGENDVILTEENKEQIDSMSYESLLYRVRFAPIGDP